MKKLTAILLAFFLLLTFVSPATAAKNNDPAEPTPAPIPEEPACSFPEFSVQRGVRAGAVAPF